jgi:hypothetical protein
MVFLAEKLSIRCSAFDPVKDGDQMVLTHVAGSGTQALHP